MYILKLITYIKSILTNYNMGARMNGAMCFKKLPPF